jgi:PAS domain S-box-containing protein
MQWGLLWLIGFAVSLSAEALIRSCRRAEASCERMEDLTRNAALFPEENPYPVMRAFPGGELLYANRAASILLEQWQCPVGARMPEAVQREVAAVLESGSPQELELRCGDRELSFVMVPIADRHYVNFYGRDVTAQKSVQQALLEAHERLRTTLESISDGFMSLDRQWRVTFVNERGAQAAGQTRKSMLGRVLWEIFPDAVGSEFERAYQHAMSRRATTSAEAFYPPLNAWFEARAYPSEDGISVFFRDISDRKQTEAKLKYSEEALRQANEHLEAMVRKRTLELEDTVARLENEIASRKKIQAQLHQLSRKSLEALEADRRSVARELHDSIGGSLAAIKFGMEEAAEQSLQDPVCGVRQLETLISHLADTIKETKRISANLRPLTIDDLGLLATIEWYTRQFCQRYENIRVIRQIGVEEQEIPEDFKIVFYRVMQEAMTNAAKHSRADTIYVRLKKDASHFEFEVEDNGSGFDSGVVFDRQDRLSGFGLRSMQERAEICGGVLRLDTQPDKGTSVRVTLPAAEIAVGF